MLSIDGGGIRGVIPATVLAELERRTARPTADLFDLVAGTSTGGILALALVCPRGGAGPRAATEVASLYFDRGESIFPLGGVPLVGVPQQGNRLFGIRTKLPPGASFTDRFKHFMGYENVAKLGAIGGGGAGQGNARYPTAPLEADLQQQLGDALMSEAVRPVVVVSCDFDTGEPLVFRGGGLPQGSLGDAKMWHVARATSAGPTFFQPFAHTGVDGVTHSCVDGGLVANDPSFVAYTEAAGALRSAGRTQDEILVVSLGTGTKMPGVPAEFDDAQQLVDRRTWLQLAPALAQAMSGGSGELMRQQLTQLLGSRFVRLQTTLVPEAVHAMDDVRPANIDALRLTGEKLVAESDHVLNELTALL